MANPKRPNVLTPVYEEEGKLREGEEITLSDAQMKQIIERMKGAEEESKSIWDRFFGD
jgi:hypothetical protein